MKRKASPHDERQRKVDAFLDSLEARAALDGELLDKLLEDLRKADGKWEAEAARLLGD